MTVVISYFITSLLRMVLTRTGLQHNLMDYRGTLDFLQTTDLQNQAVVLILSILFLVFMTSKMGLFENKYIDASSFGVHGTSRWGKFTEIINGKAMSKNNKFNKNPLKTLDVEKGIIVGKVPEKNELLIIPRNTVIDNRNVMVIGSSGSGKGQAFVFGNVINNTEESIIVTDPKGEIFDNTHQIKKDQGYHVYQIDFINFAENGYNPLDYVNDDQDAQALAKTIASNSSKDGKEDFFHMQAQNLLTGLIILSKSFNKKASMNDVIKIFNQVSEDDKYLYKVTNSIGEEHPAYQILKNASVAEGKTRSSILASLAQQIAIFTIQKVSRMVDKSDFNFREFQEQKSILYVKIRMDDNPFVPLTATFFDQLISVFYTIADENHSKLKMPVIFLLDEFANIGKIDKYPRVLATCRGLGMSCNTVIQDLGQIEAIYGKEMARSIVNNHDIKLFLRTKDTETAKYFSQMAGETTVKMETKSNSQQGGFFSTHSSASKSSSEQFVKRPLITEGEFMNIDRDTCYIFVEGFFPLKAEKAWQFVIYGDLISNYKSYRNRIKVLHPSTKSKGFPVDNDDDVTTDSSGGIEQEILSNQEKELPSSVEVKVGEDLTYDNSVQQSEVINSIRFMELANEYLEAHFHEKDIQSVNNQNDDVMEKFMSDFFEREVESTPEHDFEELSNIISSLDQSSKQTMVSIEKIERDLIINNHIDEIANGLQEGVDVFEEVNEDMEIMS